MISLISGGDIFFAKILAHAGTTAEVEVDASENENFLRNFFEENRDVIYKGVSTAANFLPLGKWAKLLMKAGVNLAQLKSAK